MTPVQIKAWQARVAANPHAAYAAAAAHAGKTGGAGTSTTSTTPAPNKLTPAQAKQMIANQQVVAPGLTQGQLNQNVNAATAQKYGDAQRLLAGAPGRAEDFYSQYQQAIKQGQAQQAQVNAAATGGIQALQGGLDQASKNQWAGQSQAMQDSAASRGATVDPTLADQAKNASTVRGILTGSYGSMLTNQGANASTNLVNRGVNAKQAEGEQLSAAQQQLLHLLQDKGTFKTQEASSLISDASKNALNQALAQNTIATGSANRALTNTETATKQFDLAYTQKYGHLPTTSAIDQYRIHYAQTHGGKFPGTVSTKPVNPTGKDAYGNTKAQRDSYNNSWDRAKSGASQIGSSGDTVQSLAQLLIAKYPTIPPWMATAAAQQHVNGYVAPGFVHRLVQHGVGKGYATQKPKAPGNPTAIPGVQ
jgi:hypothetical protein